MYEKEIVERLKEMHDSGKSYEEIARITGVSRTAVAEILAGKRHVKNPSLSMLLKVFPHAVIYLDGKPSTSSVSMQDQSVAISGDTTIANGVVGKNVIINDEKNNRSSGIPSDIRDAIISDSTMPPQEKAQLLLALIKK